MCLWSKKKSGLRIFIQNWYLTICSPRCLCAYLRCFSAQSNNVLVQWLQAQRIFMSSLQPPQRPAALCIFYFHSMWMISMSVTVSRFRSVCKCVNLMESCLREDCLRGKRAQLLFMSVSIMWDLKLLYLVYSTVKNTAAALLVFWKYLQKGSEQHLCSSKLATCCEAMCEHVWVIRCQHWMVAGKWAFCVVCL